VRGVLRGFGSGFLVFKATGAPEALICSWYSSAMSRFGALLGTGRFWKVGKDASESLLSLCPRSSSAKAIAAGKPSLGYGSTPFLAVAARAFGGGLARPIDSRHGRDLDDNRGRYPRLKRQTLGLWRDFIQVAEACFAASELPFARRAPGDGIDGRSQRRAAGAAGGGSPGSQGRARLGIRDGGRQGSAVLLLDGFRLLTDLYGRADVS
jgi:hypothetical protein